MELLQNNITVLVRLYLCLKRRRVQLTPLTVFPVYFLLICIIMTSSGTMNGFILQKNKDTLN